MTNPPSTIDVKLLVQVEDAKPTEIGVISMPIDMKLDRRGGRVAVSIDSARFQRRLRAMLRGAARAVGA